MSETASGEVKETKINDNQVNTEPTISWRKRMKLILSVKDQDTDNVVLMVGGGTLVVVWALVVFGPNILVTVGGIAFAFGLLRVMLSKFLPD